MARVSLVILALSTCHLIRWLLGHIPSMQAHLSPQHQENGNPMDTGMFYHPAQETQLPCC